jgi:hypothetical protein
MSSDAADIAKSIQSDNKYIKDNLRILRENNKKNFSKLIKNNF